MATTVWRGAGWGWRAVALAGLAVWVDLAVNSTWRNVAVNWPSEDDRYSLASDAATRAALTGVLGLVGLGVGVLGVAAWIGVVRSGRFALVYGSLWGAFLVILLVYTANRGIPGSLLDLLGVVTAAAIAISQVWVAFRARRWSPQSRDEALAGPRPKAPETQGSPQV